MQNDVLRFTWSTTIGRPGVDEDPVNPFARALDRLLRTGQPFQRFAMSFTNLRKAGMESSPRWLGTFAWSAGNRLIFFPGYTHLTGEMLGYRGAAKQWNTKAPVDHFSLEKGKGKWHLTTPKSKGHFGGPVAVPLGSEFFLWFGMSVADEHVLRELKTNTVVYAEVPETDAKRRYEIFREAREAQEFPIVSLNSEVEFWPEPGFFHFSFVVAPAGGAPYTGKEHAFPIGSPFLLNQLPNPIQGLPIATYRCGMAPFCDIHITVMRLPGRLTTPLAITSPGEPQGVTDS